MSSHDEKDIEEQQAEQKTSGKSRRRWKIAGFTLLGLVLLFLLVVFVLPSPAARLAIESQLDDLGIKHDGVDSVDIDLWNSEVKAGPITFHAGDADKGQIGEAGFRYSLKNLFEKRALVETFFIRGIDLVVKRAEDGTMTLNGIDLAELAGEKDPEKEKPEDQEKSDFGVGVDSFEFADSKLTFVEFTGGSLTLDIKRLTISDFRTWDPDTPGKVELESAVNDITWNWQGTATPFGDDIQISLQTELRDGTIDKVVQFTGPTGLARQDAQFESDMTYDYTLKPDGQIDGTIKGEIRLSAVDIATEEGAGATLPDARITLDLVQGINPDGTHKMTGDLDVESGAVGVTGPAGEKIDLENFKFHIASLDFTRYGDPAGSEQPEAAADAVAQDATTGAGEPRTVLALLLQQVEAIAQQALRDRMEIDASPSISASAGHFALPGAEDGPDQAIRFTNFAAEAPGVDSQSADDGGWSVTSAFDAVLESAWAGPAGQEDSSGIFASGGKLTAGKIVAETGAEGSSISFDVDSGLDEVAMKDPAGMNLTLGGISAGTPGMSVAGDGTGQGHIRGPVKLGVDSLQSSLPSEAGDMTLGATAFHFGSEDFDIVGDDGLSLNLSGTLGLTDLQMEKTGEAPLALGLDQIDVGLGPLTIDPLGPGAAIAGPLETTLTNLQLASGPADQAQEVSVAGTKIGLDNVALATAEPLTLELSGGLQLQDTRAKLPGADGGFQEVSVAATDIGLDKVGLSTAEPLSVDMAGAITLTDTAAKLAAADGSAQEFTVDATKIGLDQVALTAAEVPALDMTGALSLSNTTAKLPMANGDTLEAKVAQVDLSGLQAAAEGEVFSTATDINIQTIAVTTDAEVPQVIDVAALTVDGLKVDATEGIEIASVLVDQLNAEITDAIAALGGAPADDSAADDARDGDEAPGGEIADNEVINDGLSEAPEAEAASAEPATEPASDSPPFKLGKAEISSGSNVKVTDTSVEPPMKLDIAIDKMEVGPLDTSAPQTQTNIDVATTINQDSTIKANGWASPLQAEPSFDMTADVAKLPLPPFSPYVSSAAGLNIDSGILNTQAKATANSGALNGQIDVQVGELFLEPVSEEVDKEFEGNYGISANFATGLLKNGEGVIDLGFPVAGTVAEPAIDYSEVISKALGGAMASLFPLNWFGDDGSSFEILPATFAPGSTELTAEGKEAGDEIGRILTEKPQLSIRACGKATANDLIVLRGGTPPAPVEEQAADDAAGDAADDAAAQSSGDGAAETPTGEGANDTAQDAAQEGGSEAPAAAPAPLTKPSQQEVDQLLELALKRGEVVRAYLTEAHGIAADRMSECRTSYSIEDGKPPRAEFRF